MFRFLLIISLIIGGFFVLHPSVSLSIAPPYPDNILLEAGPNVPTDDIETVRRAVSFTADFWKYRCSVAVVPAATIYLVSSVEEYAHLLQKTGGLSPGFSFYQATHSLGTSGSQTIIINTQAAKDYNDLLFITAHELSHQYQLMLTHGNSTDMIWFLEGMADCIAANIVAANTQQGRVDTYYASWLSSLRAASRHPVLAGLRTRSDWINASGQFSQPVIYRTAALGVKNLSEQYDFDTLAAFLHSCRRTATADEAFALYFGQPPAGFSVEFELGLAQELMQ